MYLYPRANLDLYALRKIADNLQGLSEADIALFNVRSNEMSWQEACTVRVYLNTVNSLGGNKNESLVDKLRKDLNSLTQENISFLAKITSKMDVAIAYTFTLPPPPPDGVG